MKLTAQVKRVTTPQQHTILPQTLERANAAYTGLTEQVWQHHTFGQYALHRLCYHPARQRIDLNAQVIVRCIAKVADAYKLNTRTKRVFKSQSAIAYDAHNLSWHMANSISSLWTVAGRMKGVSFVCGERQCALLRGQRGESGLVLFHGNFYLFANCDVDEPEPKEVLDVLGVDQVNANIAVDSDGCVRSGTHIKSVRFRHRRLRQNFKPKVRSRAA